MVRIDKVADGNKTYSMAKCQQGFWETTTNCMVRVDKVADGNKTYSMAKCQHGVWETTTNCMVRIDKVADGNKTYSMASFNTVADQLQQWTSSFKLSGIRLRTCMTKVQQCCRGKKL